MGYYVHITESQVNIPKSEFANACRHLEQIGFLTDTKNMNGGSLCEGQRTYWYSWVDMDMLKEKIQGGDLPGVFHLFGFDAEFDKVDGFLECLMYDGKTGNEEHLLRCLAPFFTDGDYIEWQGEEGERWRCVFEKDKMNLVSPTILWE